MAAERRSPLPRLLKYHCALLLMFGRAIITIP